MAHCHNKPAFHPEQPRGTPCIEAVMEFSHDPSSDRRESDLYKLYKFIQIMIIRLLGNFYAQDRAGGQPQSINHEPFSYEKTIYGLAVIYTKKGVPSPQRRELCACLRQDLINERFVVLEQYWTPCKNVPETVLGHFRTLDSLQYHTDKTCM